MNKAIFGVAGLLLVGMIATGAFAFGGFGRGQSEDAQAALESGDYGAYMNAMDTNQQARKAQMTEDRFDEMVERHAAMGERRAQADERRLAVDAAMESGDYNAWLEAIAGSPQEERLTAVVTSENFPTFVAMHDAMKDGDIETAQSLAEELGLDHPGMGRTMGKGHFMN